MGEFRGDAPFNTWITRIVSNACRDELRRRRRQRLTSLDESLETEDGDVGRQYADPGDGPDQTAERRETQRLVREALLELDEDHREVLILRDFQDLSYEQIRDVLGLSMGTVKSRLNRARQALKAALEEKLSGREHLSPRGVYRK